MYGSLLQLEQKPLDPDTYLPKVWAGLYSKATSSSGGEVCYFNQYQTPSLPK